MIVVSLLQAKNGRKRRHTHEGVGASRYQGLEYLGDSLFETGLALSVTRTAPRRHA